MMLSEAAPLFCGECFGRFAMRADINYSKIIDSDEARLAQA